MSENVIWHDTAISRSDRTRRFGHENKVLWFTGLSGSGKSTLANIVEQELHKQGCPTYILDGDNIRHGLNKDLDFSKSGREENIRRIAEVALLFYDAGITVIVCFISPYIKDRENARKIIGDAFVEVYAECDLEECKRRDPKGLYKKAVRGEIPKFTGISDPYEEPKNPEIKVNTGTQTPEESAQEIIKWLRTNS